MTKIKLADFKSIASNFSGTFKNLSYKNDNKPYNSFEYKNQEILKLLKIDAQNIDSVHLSFTTPHSLVIKYVDSN